MDDLIDDTQDAHPYSKYTKETLMKLIRNLFQEGKTVNHIAKLCEIHRSTLYRWMEADELLRDAVKEARAEATDKVEESLYSLCFWQETEETREALDPRGQVIPLKTKKRIPPDFNAIRKWLDYRDPRNWSPEFLKMTPKNTENEQSYPEVTN